MIYNYKILKQDDFEFWSHLKKKKKKPFYLCVLSFTIYNFGLDINLGIQNRI